MDNEHEIPVKVIDRRRWANNAEANSDGETAFVARKPTYVEDLEQQLAEKDRLLQEHIAKYRQASSDFEEARLRIRREVGKDVERARREVLSEILDVVDNLDRAVESVGSVPSVQSLLEGVDLVRRQFLSKLEGLGVTRIAAAGEHFDPLLHEAVTTVPATSPDQDGLIVGIVRHGYRIGGDVLRPATVAVAKS